METMAARFLRLEAAVRAAQKQADDAMAYAESSARLHHEAICRLHQLAAGEYRWPAKP